MIKELLQYLSTHRFTESLKQSLETFHPSVFVPEGTCVVDLEKYQESPNHYVGEYRTNYPDEFCNYCNQSPISAHSLNVFIDPGKLRAGVCLDESIDSGHGWGKHTAIVSLIKSDEYEHIHQKNNYAFHQQELIDFITDYSHCLRAIDSDGEEMKLTDAVNAIRQLTTKTASERTSNIQDFAHQADGMERVEIESQGKPPPAALIYNGLIYEGLPDSMVRLDIRMKVTKGSDEVTLQYRIVALDELNRQQREYLRDIIGTQVDKKVKVYVGNFSYRGSDVN